MSISLDQVHALVAVADTGSIVAASRKLNKTHTAVLYQLKQLESQLGFLLLDRNKYKASLTPHGKAFLVEARRFLHAEERLRERAQQIAAGGLGRWHLVYDAIFPAQDLLEIASKLRTEGAISIRLLGDSLRSVEKTFWRVDADFIISLFPPEGANLHTHEIGKLKSLLVMAGGGTAELRPRRSPSGKAHKRTDLVEPQAVDQGTLIVVRGVDPLLPLSTDALPWKSRVIVNDFHSKREALLSGMGVGWLPEYMVQSDLKAKRLVLFSQNEKIYQREFSVYYSVRKGLEKEGLYRRTLELLRKSRWL